MNKERLRTWLIKNTKKMNSILGTKNELAGDRDLNSLKNNFLSYIKIISEHLDEVAKDTT